MTVTGGAAERALAVRGGNGGTTCKFLWICICDASISSKESPRICAAVFSFRSRLSKVPAGAESPPPLSIAAVGTAHDHHLICAAALPQPLFGAALLQTPSWFAGGLLDPA
eukprot:CAMPEP_0172854180 /NCGR_PEP_ID=MMETSP1075-20121228/57595_1 /TAXON_ID=2916 /ORGANISM="Ceratium fusus, Strain PA161109" /LENGTH=110 /DNA_ID=CAMNT_0013700797 /DNA_START=200 /DNA_END=529 /DNA_ORIENTATION=-